MSDSVKIKLSGALAGQTSVLEWTTPEGSIEELILFLQDSAPALSKKILDGNGKIRPFVGVYVNGEAVIQSDAESVKFHPRDEVLIIGSVAGG